MGVVENFKEAVSLIQKVDNLELYRLVLDLQNQVCALVEENRVLKEQAANRGQTTFRDNAYWIGEDGPFCSSCLDNSHKLIRLHKRKGYHAQCPVCKACAYDAVPSDASDSKSATIQPRQPTRSRYLDRERW